MSAQERLMKARDSRIGLMNEVLGGIRMIKFMAWERAFESQILKVRTHELKSQRVIYMTETLFTFIWSISPLLVTLISFWHYTFIRGKDLLSSVAFTNYKHCSV